MERGLVKLAIVRMRAVMAGCENMEAFIAGQQDFVQLLCDGAQHGRW
jgi:hypothetical protein